MSKKDPKTKAGRHAPGGESGGAERPTVAPPSDLEAALRDRDKGDPSSTKSQTKSSPSPAAASAPPPTVRQPMSPADLAGASPPGAFRPPMTTLTDEDALEDARVRSLRSNPVPSPRHTPDGLLSLANARVPSSVPVRKDENAIKAEGSDWEEMDTTPPPPLQQVLIDALTLGRDPPPMLTEHMAALAAAVERAAAPSSPPTVATIQEMNDRVSLGDYTGALEVAEKLLTTDPDDELVKACADNCRAVLRQMYAARVGPLDRVPVVMVPRDQMRWLSIDHRAGFVLSLVDGVSSLEMLLDVSGMPELDALRILSELAQQRIIAFR